MIMSPRYNLFLAIGCLAIMIAGFVAMTSIDRAWGQADSIVLADHAADPVLIRADLPPVADAPAVAPADGLLDHALDVAGPLGRGALGGIAVLAVAWLLARARERWGWLRRGPAGNMAATAYGALVAFGGVLAVGGSVGVGLTAIGGAMAAGMTLRRDPDTVRLSPPVAAEGGEVPT